MVDKPAGLVVHPAAGHASGTLVHGLLAACPDMEGIGGEGRPGIVHRLDKDTSGVMVAAKTSEALRKLVDDFKNGRVSKTYLALCLGWPDRDRGEIDLPIGRHPVRRKEMSTRSNRGRPARTAYQVLARYGLGIGFLSVRIFTGRTHQIRVHLASQGFPVLGDPVYGRGPAALKNGGGPLKKLVRRQLLHSHRLSLKHPVTGRSLECEAPRPTDMARVLEILEADVAG